MGLRQLSVSGPGPGLDLTLSLCWFQLNVEDPCIICHDDMSPDDICVLECRHSFHKEVSDSVSESVSDGRQLSPNAFCSVCVQCIRSWLKEQSTCPTCRDHALLPEDFPVLPGRRRPAP